LCPNRCQLLDFGKLESQFSTDGSYQIWLKLNLKKTFTGDRRWTVADSYSSREHSRGVARRKFQCRHNLAAPAGPGQNPGSEFRSLPTENDFQHFNRLGSLHVPL